MAEDQTRCRPPNRKIGEFLDTPNWIVGPRCSRMIVET